MDIPAIFAVAKKEQPIMAIDVSGCVPSNGDALRPFESAISSLPLTDDRQPAVVVDWGSISERSFQERVLKNMRIRGRDVWFMTWISDVDDVMDAFNTTADSVLAPLYAIEDRDALEDINSVSDGVYPVIFVKDGMTSFEGRRMDSSKALGILESTGFYRSVLLDTDDSVSGYDWETIHDMYPSCMPFVRSRSMLPDIPFPKVISPWN